jgi:hypothetical protein
VRVRSVDVGCISNIARDFFLVRNFAVALLDAIGTGQAGVRDPKQSFAVAVRPARPRPKGIITNSGTGAIRFDIAHKLLATGHYVDANRLLKKFICCGSYGGPFRLLPLSAFKRGAPARRKARRAPNVRNY